MALVQGTPDSGTALPAGDALLGRVKLTDGTTVALILTSGEQRVAATSTGKSLKTVTGTVAADTDIVAAVAAKMIKVYALSLFSASTTSNTITMQSNAATAKWTVILQAPAAASVMGLNLAVTPPAYLFATVAGEKLTLDVSAAVNVTYSLSYWDDDAT